MTTAFLDRRADGIAWVGLAFAVMLTVLFGTGSKDLTLTAVAVLFVGITDREGQLHTVGRALRNAAWMAGAFVFGAWVARMLGMRFFG